MRRLKNIFLTIPFCFDTFFLLFCLKLVTHFNSFRAAGIHGRRDGNCLTTGDSSGRLLKIPKYLSNKQVGGWLVNVLVPTNAIKAFILDEFYIFYIIKNRILRPLLDGHWGLLRSIIILHKYKMKLFAALLRLDLLNYAKN